MLNVTITGDKQVSANLKQMPDQMNKSLTKAITVLTLQLKDYIIRNKLSGQVLNHRSGALWRSIQQKVSSSNTEVVGTVFSSGDVKYAAIHEYGGIIKHPGGTPYYVSELLGGKAFFMNKLDHPNAPVTKAHDIPMPQRSFMRSSLKDFHDKIQSTLTIAVKEGTN